MLFPFFRAVKSLRDPLFLMLAPRLHMHVLSIYFDGHQPRSLRERDMTTAQERKFLVLT